MTVAGRDVRRTIHSYHGVCGAKNWYCGSNRSRYFWATVNEHVNR